MRKRQDSEAATINLTPMIDVVFLLVIFFMVGSKFDNGDSGVQVNVPGTGDMKSMARLPDERIVEVTATGSITLDGTSVTGDQLTQTLKTQREAYPSLKVAVRGEQNSSFAQVAEVLQRVRAAGVQQMGVATKR
ncbi:biopolymer transport protein ExbD [Neorhodopirellula lusitana]|uniref:Biopolymer transport protein ExbD n=1 Tax=Neorhodopirellula lusitana TaxID=445327 RepID=A0ABY1PZF4_9BACT|nr:biopolymer transporter ExbD [Neorhodopirellula lusitana]SMP53003.1 biopolymer transport protein ExbD [Neorhodopirellula lusitana]